MAGAQLAALGDLAVTGGEGDQVGAVELVADVAPGVVDAEFGNAQEQQGQPAQLYVGLDAFALVVKHRWHVDLDGLEVTPAALDLV